MIVVFTNNEKNKKHLRISIQHKNNDNKFNVL